MRQALRTKRADLRPIDASFKRVAPIGGWNTQDPEAVMRPEYALVLENWFPEAKGVRTRPGAVNHITGFGVPVKSLMAYASPTASSLWAATDAGIYAATNPGAVGASVATLTSGECISVNFRTSGGSFLNVVNGVDTLKRYDGSSWASVATFNVSGGGTIDTFEASYVAVFKRRLFYVRRNTLDFIYMDQVDSITGDVRTFPLGGLFSLGGKLVAIGTWTIDGGNGVDDLAVFVTSKGQVAVYQGSNPNDVDDWSLIGVYNISPPIGKKPLQKYGGDLLIILEAGIFPLSKALQSTSTSTAVTDRIAEAFIEAADDFKANYGWETKHVLNKNILLVNVPTAATVSQQYVMNTKTGAWCKVTGWNGFCMEVFNGEVYMGMATKVAQIWTSVADFGESITATAKTAFDYFGNDGMNKHVKMLRPIVKTTGTLSISIALDMDFEEGTTFGSATFTSASGGVWDVGKWDEMLWSAGFFVKEWLTAYHSPGRCAALRLRVITTNASVFWSATDYVVEGAGIL